MSARSSWLLFKLILIASLALTPAAQANSILNGSFETGDFTGWTLSGNTGFSGVDAGTKGFAPGPYSGSFAAFFGPVGSLGFLSQNVTTIPGASYNLTFRLANDGFTPNEFLVSWNGDVILDQVNLPAFGYTQGGFSNLLATGASTSLQFGFLNDAGFFYMDGAYVGAGGAIPEPTTFLLFGTTVAGLGLARWRQRRKRGKL